MKMFKIKLPYNHSGQCTFWCCIVAFILGSNLCSLAHIKNFFMAISPTVGYLTEMYKLLHVWAAGLGNFLGYIYIIFYIIFCRFCTRHLFFLIHL